MGWLPLTLLCAWTLASADAATKRWLGDYRASELVLVRFVCTGLLLAPLLLVRPPPALPLAFWGWIGPLVPLELLAMLLYMRAIRDSPLSLTLPYLAFTPVLTSLTGLVVLGERVSPLGLAGIGLVVAGTYLLNLNPGAGSEARPWWAPLGAMLAEPGARLMLAVAAIYSVTSVLGKGALQYLSPATFGPLYFGLLGLATMLWFALTGRPIVSVLRRRPAVHLLVGALMGVMVVTHFLAIAKVEVAYMIAVKRTSLLFGIVYGSLWFAEPALPRRLLGGSLMVCGVFLIAL